MKGKWTLVLVVVMVVSLLIPAVAFADQGGGTGTLVAQGDGLAGLRGGGQVTISGRGVLYIKDSGGDAVIQVSGNGIRTELPSGWIRYAGFDGEAQVRGSAITVALSGVNIHLRATGHGRFALWGTGTYEVNGITGVWTERGQVLELPAAP